MEGCNYSMCVYRIKAAMAYAMWHMGVGTRLIRQKHEIRSKSASKTQAHRQLDASRQCRSSGDLPFAIDDDLKSRLCEGP